MWGHWNGMEQVLEFTVNHPALVGALVALACALAFTEMRKGGRAIGSHGLTQLVNKDSAIVVDVREKADFNKGHIVGSLHIPYSKLQEKIGELSSYKDKPVIVVDAAGQHGSTATKILKDAGLTQVMKLKGGISTWQADSLPLAKK